MFRKADKKDIAAIECLYNEVHTAEEAGKTATGWKRGVYPVRQTAESAVLRGEMFVYEEDGQILASAVLNQTQVDVYAGCRWRYPARDREVLVIHTLCVSPAHAGRGIGTAFIGFYEARAAQNGCKVLRLDTNAVNTNARRFYKKLGYIESGSARCAFNGIGGVELILLEKKISE